MPLQQFTLIVEGPDLQSEPLIDALFDAGCDDATVGRVDGVQYVDFDRDADNLGDAVLSAVRDLETLEGVRVIRVADADIVSRADIVARTLRSYRCIESFPTIAHQPSGFPSFLAHPGSRSLVGHRFDIPHSLRGGSASRQTSTTPSVPSSTQNWNVLATSTFGSGGEGVQSDARHASSSPSWR